MAGAPKARPGELRTEQNWIGGRLDSPIDARYIPPPETEVAHLVDDLVEFINRDDLPAAAQAAIAHAQFETIHPFIDGNGRVGRCLIHVVLRRRRVAPRFVPPVSIVLAARPNTYVEGLVGFREGQVAPWCASFAAALERSARLSVELAAKIARLEAAWYERAGRPRRDSAAARIIPILPAQPITSAAIVRGATNARHQRALEGLKTLEAAGVVRRISETAWDQQYAADELFDVLEGYEQAIASGHDRYSNCQMDREAAVDDRLAVALLAGLLFLITATVPLRPAARDGASGLRFITPADEVAVRVGVEGDSAVVERQVARRGAPCGAS